MRCRCEVCLALEDTEARRSSSAAKRVYIRTFGYFEVYVDGMPLAFSHRKSRELLAILVDRQGGFVSGREAASMLWEDEEVTRVVMVRFRKALMYLSKTLENAGVGYLIERGYGECRAALEKTDCDLMEYLRLGSKAKSQFKGTYMREYAWAETTAGELAFSLVEP